VLDEMIASAVFAIGRKHKVMIRVKVTATQRKGSGVSNEHR
jgi:hypothetical protein